MVFLNIVIGNQRYSSWSLRGWLAAKMTGLSLSVTKIAQFEDEDMAQLRSLSPTGLVPVLQDYRGDGEPIVVWDALSIIDYLNDTTDTAFWPDDHSAKGLARSLASDMHRGYGRIRRACPMNLGLRLRNLELSDALTAEIERLCRQLELALLQDRKGPYLFGDWSAADIMYAPVATRIRTYDLPVTGPVMAWADAIYDHPHVQQWLDEAANEAVEIPKYENPARDRRLIFDDGYGAV